MNQTNRTILLIEDDEILQRFLTLALKTNGYDVLQAKEGAIGLAILANQHADLILLDLGLPDMDGIDVLKEIKTISTQPVIIISARGREVDKVSALDMGANDYVTKPFNIGEVLARIRVALRSVPALPDILFEYQQLKIDFEKRLVLVNDQEVHLTPIEFKLLELMVRHQGKVLTHHFIQEHVWGYHTVDDYQSLRVFMASIRKKINQLSDESYILTEVGVGYRFKE